MTLELLIHQPTHDVKRTPLLFVHGFVHAAWCYEDYFLPYFAQQGYNAAALSLQGHGASPVQGSLRWKRLVKHYVADVAQAAAQLEQQFGTRPVIIGHSMGGIITQHYLARHMAPAGILLASCPTHGVIMTVLRSAWKYPLRFLRANLMLDFSGVHDTPEIFQREFFSADMPREQVMKHFNRRQPESFMAVMDMLLFALPNPAKVRVPILVIAAENDVLFHPWEEERLARAYRAEYALFPNMAHDVMLEKDWQHVADKILAWLQQQAIA